MHTKMYRVSVVAALATLLSFAVPAGVLAAEPDVTGVWKGTYAAPDDSEALANATITIKRSGSKYSGSISLTDEKINVPIRSCEVDDDYLAVSGVMTATAPDGRVGQAHLAFGGFLDGDGKTWEGNWTVSDKDGNVGGGNIFMLERQGSAGKPAPSGGGDEVVPPAPKKPNAGGLVGTKPKTSKPTPPKPDADSGDAKPQAGGGKVSMAGSWQGTYSQTNNQAGTLSIDLRETGGKYAGDGRAIDDDGTEIPPIAFTSGRMAGKKFALDGTMTLVTDDGEEFPATVSMSGEVNGDAWRGNILVKAEIEGEEVAVISGMFRLKREGGAPAKTGSGSSGITGGGMIGKGNKINPGK